MSAGAVSILIIERLLPRTCTLSYLLLDRDEDHVKILLEEERRRPWRTEGLEEQRALYLAEVGWRPSSSCFVFNPTALTAKRASVRDL